VGSAGKLRGEVEELIAMVTAEPFGTVSDWSANSSPARDADVVRLLDRAANVDARPDTRGAGARGADASDERVVAIPVDGDLIAGGLGPSGERRDGAAAHAGSGSDPRGLMMLARG